MDKFVNNFLLIISLVCFNFLAVQCEEGTPRPCEVTDLTCIRDYFGSNADCCVQQNDCFLEPIPRPSYLATYKHANFTLKPDGPYDSYGLAAAKISDFYVNETTNDLVIGLTMPLNVIISKWVTYKFNDTNDKVVQEIKSSLIASFPSTTVTASIPRVDGKLQLSQAYVTAQLNNKFAYYYIGPEVMTSDNPVVKHDLEQFLPDPYYAATLNVAKRTGYYIYYFIQNRICDFGLDLSNK